MVRTARREDLAAVVAVMTAVDIATLGEPDTTEEDIASGWEDASFDVEADAFVAEDADAIVVGYAEIYDRGEGGYFDTDVYAHPEAGDEVAEALLDAVVQRATVRAGQGSVLSTWLPAGDSRTSAYASRGFVPVRKFVRMRFTAGGGQNRRLTPRASRCAPLTQPATRPRCIRSWWRRSPTTRGR